METTGAQGGRKNTIRGRSRRLTALCIVLFCLLLPLVRAAAAVQFDVFLGYGNDNIVREANWFPVTCEVNNDGPAFTGSVEITPAGGSDDDVRGFVLELPTNTRKRVVIPMFGAGGRYRTWDARLRDERGKVVAEQLDLRPGADMNWDAALLGSLSRTFPGSPRLPKVPASRRDDQPRAARFRAAVFPDNPIALEGMDALYLNSEIAVDLSVGQVNAILAWLHGGGHLIVAVESVSDVKGTPWLDALMPCTVSGGGALTTTDEIHDWLRKGAMTDAGRPAWRIPPDNVADVYDRLKPDPGFTGQEFPVVKAVPKDGRVLLRLGNNPLIVSAFRDRGTITALAFSPEKEPFKSWEHQPWFWSHLLKLPPAVYNQNSQPNYTNYAIDGAFGGMIDSKQVRKLPVHWLLLLLVVYLLVIGPFDQWWLKKINRQMLTWITFPCYVVLFSVLIYWIGYWLRAGETEWNELHIVDVHPQGDQARLRGRTYASIYSPSNARYKLAGVQPVSALRGEFMGARVGVSESGRATVMHQGDGYDAEIYVPVWTSQLYVNDWWEPAELPLKASLTRQGSRLTGSVSNLLPRKLDDAHIVYNGRIHSIGSIGEGEVKEISLGVTGGIGLRDFVQAHAGNFANAIDSRRRAFGSSGGNYIRDVPKSVIAAGFTDSLRDKRSPQQNNYRNTFVTPVGFEIGDVAERGQAVVLAWDNGGSLTGRMNQFSPRRSHTDTLLRLSVRADQDTRP